MSPKFPILTALFIPGVSAAIGQTPDVQNAPAASQDKSSAPAHCVDVNGQVQPKSQTTGAQTISGRSSADKPDATNIAGGDSANAPVANSGPPLGSASDAQQKQASNGPPC
jgi:hypothetical protein